MQTDAPNADRPKHKRRWLQFSLRSLLIGVTLLAIPFAWLGRKIEQKRHEREWVQATSILGGWMQYDYQAKNLGQKPPGPDWLRQLLGENFFSEIVGAHLQDVADAGARMASIKGITTLKMLRLEKTRITDIDLVNVRGLTQLHELNLAGTRVTDAGLVNLKGLIQLQDLDLCGTEVTDAGLANLKGMLHLKWLMLWGTKVTDGGVKDLQKSLPNCVIWKL